jgi:hypothetical protein
LSFRDRKGTFTVDGIRTTSRKLSNTVRSVITMSTELSRVVLLLNKEMTGEETRIAGACCTVVVVLCVLLLVVLCVLLVVLCIMLLVVLCVLL